MKKAIVFDAYGTLFDVHSVAQACEAAYPGFGEAISKLWRQKQLEYTWLRTLMQRYLDFWQITQDALCFALDALDLPHSEAQAKGIMQAYLTLSPYPEALHALEALRGFKLCILSNGTAQMLEAVSAHTGLASYLHGIYSADAVRQYKPHPYVYALCTSTLGVLKEEILFVSSNAWDIAGAKSFGFATCWVNRAELPMEHLGFAPDDTAADLKELAWIVNTK